MDHIRIGKKSIEYSIKRGKRKKTVAINILPTSQVAVLAPDFVSREKIKIIVAEKAKWIIEKQEYFKNLSTLFPEKDFISGEQILFLGRRYRLKVNEIIKDQFSKPKLQGRRIFVTVKKNIEPERRKETVKNLLIKWYVHEAEKIVARRIKKYSNMIGTVPQGIIIKEQKKRWGSCSAKGVLRFNWKLVMAPMSIIDYIIVHELCHLKVKNHSKEFWGLVSLIIPKYRERKDWLKNNTGIFQL